MQSYRSSPYRPSLPLVAEGAQAGVPVPRKPTPRLQEPAGGDGQLDRVGVYERRGVGDGGELGAAAGVGFQLPIVQRGAGDGHVVAGASGLAVGKGLYNFAAAEFVVDGGEVQRVAPDHIISRKC